MAKILRFRYIDFRMKGIEIIFENEEILVINKSAGISVQGGKGINHPLDLELSRQLGYKIFLVHRLDKETAGLMIVAKSPKAAAKWINLISSKAVQKEYTAVTFGSPKINGKKAEQGTFNQPVKKQDRILAAKTDFYLEEEWEFEVLQKSLPETLEHPEQEHLNLEPPQKIQLAKIHLKLETGRMHQIRIHLSKAGSPIVGDEKYGNFKLNKIASKNGCKKMCLASTVLVLPINGKKQVFKIKEPDYFFWGKDFS